MLLLLLSILDLEKATVEDIMIPRNEIVGIDISEPWDDIREVIIASSHTRLPVFDGSIDDLKGIVDLALASYGRIDAVLNHTGHPPKGDLLEITDENWDLANDTCPHGIAGLT